MKNHRENTVIDFNAAKERIIEKRLQIDAEKVADDLTPEEFCDAISSQLVGDLVALIYQLDLDIVSKEGTIQDIMLVGEALRSMFNRHYDINNQLQSVSESLFTISNKADAVEYLLELAEDFDEDFS